MDKSPSAADVVRPRLPTLLRLANAAGELLQKAGLPPARLDEQSLCRAACRKTGLADLGDDQFRFGLRQQIEASQLIERCRFVGRKILRVALLKTLCNRLLIEQQIKEHPEILQLPVPRPIVIAALPRTGTTLLQNLLAQDPAGRALLLWETLSPAAPRTENGGARLRQLDRLLRLVDLVIPAFRSVHALLTAGPAECGRLFRHSFVLPGLGEVLHGPGQETPADILQWAYRQYYRQLQLLQWKRPASGHWVLKWPGHLYSLEILLETLPGAVIVQTHRDPCRVISSVGQLAASFAFPLSGERWRSLPRDLMTFGARVVARAMEARQRIPASRVFDVGYQRLVADPLAVVREIYDYFGYCYTPEFDRRAKQWLAEHPKPERAKRYHDLGQFGIDPQTVQAAFSRYSERYQVEPED